MVVYREGLPALRSFAAFAALLTPLGAALFGLADSDGPSLAIAPLATGLAAFVCAFLLPRRRRRLVVVLVVFVYIGVALLALAGLLWFLYLKSQCPPDAYECPF
jgi:hypothetical protein